MPREPWMPIDPLKAKIDKLTFDLSDARMEIATLKNALETIRKFSSAIERGEEPWREGVQEITRMSLAALEKAKQP